MGALNIAKVTQVQDNAQWTSGIKCHASLHTVEPVLSSHSREAKNLAAKGMWLFNAG